MTRARAHDTTRTKLFDLRNVKCKTKIGEFTSQYRMT